MILAVTINASIDKRYVVEECRHGEVNRVSECFYTAGGKGLNVARVAAITGENVMAAGFLRGHTGQYIAEQMKEQEIINCCVQISGENRSCINIYDKKTGKQTEYLEPGEVVSEMDVERFTESYRQLLTKCDVVTISGSILPGMDRKIYKYLVKMARKAGCPVLVDTSGDLLSYAIEAGPDMIKPNLDEIQAYMGRRIETEKELVDAGISLKNKGVGLVTISLGEKGSLAVSDQGIFRVKPPVIQAVNTVGCGDAMMAGFAVGFARGLSLKDTLKLAAAVSAANAVREETGFFLMEDMERMVKQVSVEEFVQN